MLLFVRGDLQSTTGWSRATRALISAIVDDYSAVFGVDLHYHPRRSKCQFPGAIIDEVLIRKGLTGNRTCVVLHAALPNEIYRIADAVNIGWWFWETDKLPNDGDWIERLGSLDHILVPSEWQKAIMDDLRLPVPVSVAPWSHSFAEQDTNPAELDANRKHTSLYRCWSETELARTLDIDRRFHLRVKLGNDSALFNAKVRMFDDQRVSFKAAMAGYEGFVFAIQSDAPRKGLPVLINEWCEYRRNSKKNLALVIRFSALDVGLDEASILQRFSEIALSAARGSDELQHVYVILSTLTDGELASFYAGADVFIAPTYGEGFGGTLVEAVQNGCPIIVSGHSACAQLLPDNYSGMMQSRHHVGALIGQLPIQPANGSWHVPAPGEITRALLWAEDLTLDERRREVMRLRSHMQLILSPNAVREVFRNAVARARPSEQGSCLKIQKAAHA